ncbi:hypothetical protein [Pedobacter punctiformis]|uniref:DUF4436 domain-containing protein n=1 Tax=Pedobacter punctiformis TaxID=3004097 RepID=A0ABT4L4P8_9SPHI|nr:hypothetical protein [Pedobacter sp. HCMS5-2]MCZ4242896.1 hypothetical protein [Pedobacter sp. HCMS5-2]
MKFLLGVIFALSFICCRANMAKPYNEGSEHSLLLFGKEVSVNKEFIKINVIKDTSALSEHFYLAHYLISYELNAAQNQLLPLLFIAIDLENKPVIKLNGKVIQIEDLKKKYAKDSLGQYSFIKPYRNDEVNIFYKKDESKTVSISNLVYFNANVIAGKNVITVEYNASLGNNNFGFVRNFDLEYALFPSKYWKSFGPIHIELNIPKELGMKSSSIGNPEVNDQKYSWVLNQVPEEDLKISLGPNLPFLAKILIAISPFGIAILFTLGTIFIHYKKVKNHRKSLKTSYNWALAIGIFLVPVLFYTVYFSSFSLIDWILGDISLDKHGYVFLFIFTLPVFWIIYGLFSWAVDISLKSKFKPKAELIV